MLYIPQDAKIKDLLSPLPNAVTAKYHHLVQGRETQVRVYSVKSESDPERTYPVHIVRYRGLIVGVDCACPAHRKPLPPFKPKPCKHVAMALAKDLLLTRESDKYHVRLEADWFLTVAEKARVAQMPLPDPLDSAGTDRA